MLTLTNALFVVIAAVARAGGKAIRPRLARRRKAPAAALALHVRARRRLRRDYRLALLSARAG